MVLAETIQCLKALQWGRLDKKKRADENTKRAGAMRTNWLL